MNKTLITVALALLLGILGSCSDKSTNPEIKPERYYRVIYSYVAPEFSILSLDSRTGEVLDSTWYPELPYGLVIFSHDGNTAYYSGRDAVWAIDATTGETTAVNRERSGGDIRLAPNETALLSIRATDLVLYSVPDLHILFERSGSSAIGTFHPFKDILYFSQPGAVYDYDTLYVLDFGQSPPSLEAVALKDSIDQLVPPGPMVVSGDGRWLLSFSYNWLFLTDLDSLKVRHVYKSLHFSDANYSTIFRAPGGQRAFLGYADRTYQRDVGGLDIFDFQTQKLENFIDQVIIPGTDEYLRPWKVLFTPDGDAMLGVSSHWAIGGYDLFRIDLATKELSLFAPNRGARGEYPQVFVLDPKPLYK